MDAPQPLTVVLLVELFIFLAVVIVIACLIAIHALITRSVKALDPAKDRDIYGDFPHVQRH